MFKRALLISATCLLALVLIVLPVYAISIGNPDTITFGSGTGASANPYRVFQNVLETGDYFFAAEGVVYYSVAQNYTASQAFLFEIMDTTNTTVLFATPLTSYGDRPIGIYITAAQASAVSMNGTPAYVLKITGNPLVFSSPTGNTVSATLAPGDYFNEATFGTIPSGRGYYDPLRLWCLITAANMITYDTALGILVPPNSYTAYVQGWNYLSITGGSLFISGMPNLNNFCPLLFQSSVQQLTAPAPTGTGTYAGSLTPLGQMGGTIAGGLNAIGRWVGIGGDNGGMLVLLVASIIVCAYIYKKTESGIVVLLLGIATPFAGVFLGLMPMALMFIVVLVVVIIMLYYFFSRGIL
jgi:hypothetical protein